MTAGSRSGGRSALEVALVPQLEREQRPELLAVVAAPVQVFIDQPLDDKRIEEALAREPFGRKHRQHLLLQRAPKPLRDRNPEPLLAPGENRGRKDSPPRALKEELG